MNHIEAIGFDLFNTLITVEAHAHDEAVGKLCGSLIRAGIPLDDEDRFKKVYIRSAVGFVREAARTGIETHNRFWISGALETMGFDILPDDPRIASSVDAYFSAFLRYSHLVPGTCEMLGTLKGRYRLGLLSNFTHAPAAFRIMDGLGLAPFFGTVVISGEIGYRKPHPLVFQRLVEGLGVERDRVLYVGDDIEPDISGARSAGLQPVWTTYVRDHNLAFAPGILSEAREEPDLDVPRICEWKDLISLLGDKGSPSSEAADP